MCIPIAVAALALVGCGPQITPPDLFLVQRTGSVTGARLIMVVDDEGYVRCNGGPRHFIGDEQLLAARGIQEDLHDPASENQSLAPRPGSVFSYLVRDENGTVRFSDNSSGQPKVFHELTLFVLRTAQRACHLPM